MTDKKDLNFIRRKEINHQLHKEYMQLDAVGNAWNPMAETLKLVKDGPSILV